MKLINGIKQLIYKSDLLCSTNLLRIKGEPQHQTLLGGFISISLMIALAAIFYNKIIDTLNRVVITSSFSATNAEDPSSFNFTTIDSGTFMFGVEVWHHDLNSGKRYFDVTLTNTVYSYGEPQDTSVQYTLEPCRKDHWDGYPKIQNDYQRLNISYWMCLPKDTSFQIKGKYSSAQSKTLDVAVKKCTNNSFNNRSCATQAQIDQLFVDNGGPMFFTIYFLNPLINPDSEKYLSYYLEDSNYIAFSPNGGEQSRIFVEDFEISTDLSIFPFSDYLVQSGGIISSSPLKSTYTQITETYAVFFFYKSPASVNYNRSFQKIDQVFSYIGGLFGTILIIFFLISSYNTYKFEINIAGYLYSNKEDEEKLEKKYNFFYFIGQLAYAVLKTINCKPKWQKLKYYYETRQQTLKQLDVLYLFKRINFLEKSVSLLFNDSQLKGLHLGSHATISEAMDIRKSYKLKPKLKNQIKTIIKKDSNSTFQVRTYQAFFQNNSKNNKVKPQSNEFEMEQDHFNSDGYSSQCSSNQEQSNILDSIIELKKDGQKNLVSKKIWRNIDKRLKNIINPIIKIQRSKQQPQQKIVEHQFQNIINAEEQSHQNLLYFLDSQILEKGQEKSQEKNENKSEEKSEEKSHFQNNNMQYAKEAFSKLKPIRAESSFDFTSKEK